MDKTVYTDNVHPLGDFKHKRGISREQNALADAAIVESDDRADADRQAAATKTNQAEQSRRFVKKYGKLFFYVDDFKQWYLNNGYYWTPCYTLQPQKCASELLRDTNLTNTSDRNAVLEGAQPDLAKEPDWLNADPFLVQTEHATYNFDYRTNDELPIDCPYKIPRFNPYDEDDPKIYNNFDPLDLVPDLITMSTHIDIATDDEYEDSKKASYWFNFLHQLFPHKDNLDWFQLFMGMTLLGMNRREQLFAFIYGPGGNGKTVLMRALMHALGEYAGSLSSRYLIRGNKPHLDGLARLANKRLAVCNEIPAGATWEQDIIKSLTGGDKMQVQLMRKKFYDVVFSFTLIAVGNDKPNLINPDVAIARRLRFIHLSHKPEKVDGDLLEKLKSEARVILRWLFEGATKYMIEYYYQGKLLYTPKDIEAETKEYIESEDIFNLLIGKEEKEGKPFVYDKGGEGVKTVRALALANEAVGHVHWTTNKLKKGLEKKGIKCKHTDIGDKYFGIYENPLWNADDDNQIPLA